MPLEINCRDIGLIVHNIAKELRKTLNTFIESRCIKVFVTTHKTLFIFIDDILEKNKLLKNIAEVLSRYNVQCEFRISPVLGDQSPEMLNEYYSQNLSRSRM